METMAPPGYAPHDKRSYHPKTGAWIGEATFRRVEPTILDGIVRAIDNGPETDTAYLETGETVSAPGWTWIRLRRGDRLRCAAQLIVTETDIALGRTPKAYRATR